MMKETKLKNAIVAMAVIGVLLIGATEFASAQDYESAPVFPPAEVLSEDLLASPSHKVTDNVTTVGGLYSVSLWSRYGWYHPESLDMLKIRVAEIKALDALTKLREEPLFLEGLSGQVGGTLEGTVDAIKNPIGTIKKIPLGLGKFGSRVGARLTEGAPTGESGRIGYQAEKRKLAYQLGVDPYSDNARLQEGLNTVASNKNLGALTPRIGALFVPGGVGLALSSAQLNKSLQEKLRDMTGPEIQRSVGEKLEALGCDRNNIERFLSNPGYTPTTRIAIAEAMSGLRGVQGVGQFISAIQETPRPEVALFHQRRIQMAEMFHREKRRLKELRIIEDTPVFYDETGRAVVTLNIDFFYWDGSVERKVKTLSRGLGGAECDLFYTGLMSTLASDKLTENGFTLLPSVRGE